VPVRPRTGGPGRSTSIGLVDGPRWLAYYSDRDRLVPVSSARLNDTNLTATNVLIPGPGHLTICRHPKLLRSVIDELKITEERLTG